MSGPQSLSISRSIGSLHFRCLSFVSLPSCSVSIWICAARFITSFRPFQPSKFAARITSHYRTFARGMRSKQCLFKNSLLISVSITASAGHLSEGSDSDSWNLGIWSNWTRCTHAIVPYAKLGFCCLPLDQFCFLRGNFMPNVPWICLPCLNGDSPPTSIRNADD
jgi:hypothetical protein